MRMVFYTGALASVLGIVLAIGLGALILGSNGPTSPGTASAAASSSFVPEEAWQVDLTFEPVRTLNTDFGPRRFGVHPECTTAYDESFINGERCDRGRPQAFVFPYRTTFYYPNNPKVRETAEDEDRLLTSRYNAGAGDVRTWPIRVEVTGAISGDKVIFSWVTSEILNGPGTGDTGDRRPVVLKAGQAVDQAGAPISPPENADRIEPVGSDLIDFLTGQGSGGVICQPTANGHSCTLLNVQASVNVDALFVIVVGSPPATTAIIDAPTSGDEGSSITFDGSKSITSDTATSIISYDWDFGDGNTSTGITTTHIYADGTGDTTFIVTLRVEDNLTSADTTTQPITIRNVAPIFITGDATPSTVNEGGTSTITVTATDVPADIPGLRYSFDCDNDPNTGPGGFEIGPQTGNFADCTFPDNSLHPVNVQVDDQEGGTTTGVVNVTVNNLPPTITNVVPTPIVLPAAGGTSTITVNATDPAGALDPLEYSFDCNGNGNFTDLGDKANRTANTADCTFTSADQGVNTINILVDDEVTSIGV